MEALEKFRIKFKANGIRQQIETAYDNSYKWNWYENTDFYVDIVNSKQQVMSNLGLVVQIDICRYSKSLYYPPFVRSPLSSIPLLFSDVSETTFPGYEG